MGDLLYRLKYRGDRTALDPIADTVAEFLERWGAPVDALVPVPPNNTARQVQPVLEVARAVCKRTGIPLCDCLRKVKETGQLKDVFDLNKRAALLRGAFAVDRNRTEGRRLLLFDDLFRSGATATTITRTLLSDGHAASVFLLTLTRPRRKS